MASSSLADDSYDHYDVFLSFRGEDTRYNFTSHLYDALTRNNVKAFIDYMIDRGDEITPALERAIDAAKISIVVLSKNYADSKCCLDELVRIMECKESKAQIVLPIFYKINTSTVTYQEAFASHEPNIKVKEWKSTFFVALKLAGWHIVENSDEVKIIGEVTKVVLEKLNNNLPKGEELMCTSMVGQKAEEIFKKIWECLMNDRISRVGLYGMGGVGKTSIATRINNQLLATVNSFSRVYWVTVPKDFSICNLQNKIANVMGLDFSNEGDERKRAAKLKKKLKTEKFVLILDDVWKVFEIENVGIPPLSNGKKLLMTSRNSQVCKTMECEPIEVKPLSEKEALDLFIKESKCQINDSSELGHIVGSIVKECGGLPLAIVVVGRSMRGVEEIWKWRDTLRELQKPCEGENLDIENKVLKLLKFSYDRLPSDKCRQCFLYCSLFPKDHLLYRKYLIEYWIGVGLIDGIEGRQAELDKGNVILDELVHASLLENDLGDTKMHDVIRDMTHKIEEFGLQFEDPFESVLVLDQFESFPDSALSCSKLKTLVLDGEYIKKLPGWVFANMQSLNVLHIKHMRNLKSIPECFAYLGNLRLLIIEYCGKLKCIPSIGGLGNLRHLKIFGNERLEEVPEGIESLVNLRVLNLSWNKNLFNLFKCGVLEQLSHLRILDLRNLSVLVEVEVLISLEKLEAIYIHFYNFKELYCYIKSGHWQRLIEYDIHYGKEAVELPRMKNWLKTISFRGMGDVEECKEFGMFLPNNIRFLELQDWEGPMSYYFKNSNFVSLQCIHICAHKSMYLFTIDLAQHLHNVQELFIYCCDELEEIVGREDRRVNPSNSIDYPTIRLARLKVLKLAYLPELRSIYRGRMVCPSLKFIEIRSCDKVERLPFYIEKEGGIQNPSIEVIGPLTRSWWDSLQWNDPNVKSMYQHSEL